MREDKADDFPVSTDADFEPDPNSIERYEQAAGRLFIEIESRFGKDQARRIFGFHSGPSHIPIHQWKKHEVIGLYYSMKPWPNKLALARELAEKNKTSPKEKRYGTGSTDMSTFHKYIGRAVAEFERKSPNLVLLLKDGSGSKPRPKRTPK